jgi:hypothetical protein
MKVGPSDDYLALLRHEITSEEYVRRLMVPGSAETAARAAPCGESCTDSAHTIDAREEVSAMQNIKVGRYENTEAGYLGWIEPEDATWIAFVRDDHVPEVYLDRDPETGAVL